MEHDASNWSFKPLFLFHDTTLNTSIEFSPNLGLLFLSFQFEGSNLHQLVLKICRARFAPVSPRFSPDLQSLIPQLFQVSPRDRPSINSILKKPFLENLIAKYLTPEVSFTVFLSGFSQGFQLAGP